MTSIFKGVKIISMGNVPLEDTKRNKELIADYQKRNGVGFVYTTSQLVAKYNISSTRIYEILGKYNIPARTLRGKI